MRVFQILIVSAVKICKQCLQTASAWAYRPLPGLCPWTPLYPQTPWAIAPPMKIFGAAMH